MLLYERQALAVPCAKKIFRWCTVRLKIDPSNRFIRDVVRDNGEAILVRDNRWHPHGQKLTQALNMATHDKGRLLGRRLDRTATRKCIDGASDRGCVEIGLDALDATAKFAANARLALGSHLTLGIHDR